MTSAGHLATRFPLFAAHSQSPAPTVLRVLELADSFPVHSSFPDANLTCFLFFATSSPA